MKIPGRARCICFLDKYIHNAKTGKFNRKQYRNKPDLSRISQGINLVVPVLVSYQRNLAQNGLKTG